MLLVIEVACCKDHLLHILLLGYHKTCYVRFVNPKYFKLKLTTKMLNPCGTSDESVIDFVMKEILNNQDKIWNLLKYMMFI